MHEIKQITATFDYCRKNDEGTTEALVVQEVSRKRGIDGIVFFPYTKGNDSMKDISYRKAKCYAEVNAFRFGFQKSKYTAWRKIDAILQLLVQLFP